MRIIILLAILLNTNMFSQVGINTSNPEPSSILDINSTDKGILIPRVEITDLYDSSSPILNPAHGLMVFNTHNLPGQEEGFYYWNGSRWAKVGSQNLIYSKTSKKFSAPIQISQNGYDIISGMELDFIAHNNSVLLIFSSSGRSSGTKTIGEVYFRVLNTKINDVDIIPIILGGTSTKISGFYDQDPYGTLNNPQIFYSRRWSGTFSVLLENLEIGNKYRIEIEAKALISLGENALVQILQDSHLFNTDKTDHITISIIH